MILYTYIRLCFRADTTEPTGHLLGWAQQNHIVPTAVRNMSSIETGMLRLVLHCTLYMAANMNPRVILLSLILKVEF